MVHAWRCTANRLTFPERAPEVTSRAVTLLHCYITSVAWLRIRYPMCRMDAMLFCMISSDACPDVSAKVTSARRKGAAAY